MPGRGFLGIGVQSRVANSCEWRTAGHPVVVAVHGTDPEPGREAWGVMVRVGCLGSGLPDAIQSVDVVVHCASDPPSPESDVAGITNLIQALGKIGRDAHRVYISIVGVGARP